MWWDTAFSWGLRIAASAGGLYLVGVGLMYFFQEKMVYVPRLPGMPNEFVHLPDKFRLEYEDVWLTTADGVSIHAWLLWPPGWTAEERKNRPTIIFFQENAGNLQFRLYFLRLMAQYLRVSILAISYRGYGPSQGSPTEVGLQADAAAALKYLLEERKDVADKDRIVLYGRSLGGAVALHLAAKNRDKIRAAIVENTFTSIVDLAPRVAPFLKPVIGPGRPFNWLIRQRWDNKQAAQGLKDLPILWVSGLKDEMVPADQMKALYQLHSDSSVWEWNEYPDGRHMEIYEQYQVEYWTSLQRFLAKHVDGPAAHAGSGDNGR